MHRHRASPPLPLDRTTSSLCMPPTLPPPYLLTIPLLPPTPPTQLPFPPYPTALPTPFCRYRAAIATFPGAVERLVELLKGNEGEVRVS